MKNKAYGPKFKGPEGAITALRIFAVVNLLFGVILGMFFLGTDYASSPFNRRGMLVFGLGCGILVVVLRVWSNYPDGVVFAIIIMNLFTPLLDKIKKKPVKLEVTHMDRRVS